MYRILLLICISLIPLLGRSQEEIKADSTLANYFYEVGFGFSNVGELALRGIDGQQLFPIHDQVALSLSQHTKSDKYLRFGMVMGLYREQITGGTNSYINPFITTFGIEKKRIKNRWAFSYGTDLYFITTFIGTNIGGQIWQMENSGGGIAGLVSASYFIHPRFSIRTETEIGFGVRQNFKNAGFVTQKVLTPTITPIKTLGIELKYHF